MDATNNTAAPLTAGGLAGGNLVTPFVDDKRASLLDHVRDFTTKRGPIVNRVIVCGQLIKTLDSNTDMNSHYQKLFKQFNDSEIDGNITGLLLLFSTSWIHLLEATPKVINAFLHELHQQPSHDYFKAVKVLLLADDVAERAFSFWSARSMTEITQVDNGPAAADNTATTTVSGDVDESLLLPNVLHRTIGQIILRLIHIGNQLSSLNKNDIKPALEELPTRFKDQLPRNEMLMALSSNGKTIDLESWLRIYDCHTTLFMDEERVWPTRTLIEL